MARKGEVKGYDVFLRALDLMREEWADRVLVRVAAPEAEGPLLPDGYVAQVVHLADDSGLREFYQSLDIFISPSRQEGFGLAPLEAMACGIPVVLTRCGGHLEYAHEENAVLVAPADAEALAKGLGELLEDSAMRRRLAVRGLADSAQFSMSNMIRAYQDLFRQFHPYA